MYVVAVRLPLRHGREDEAIDAFHRWTANLHDNGQILGNEFVVARTNSELVIHFFLPAPDALDSRYDNPGYTRNRAELLQAAGVEPVITLIGEDTDHDTPCRCADPSGFILFTHFLTLESPLRCADCFGPRPLYTLPRKTEKGSNGIVGWQDDYKSLDSIQIGCSMGERFALREMGRHDSRLSQRGCTICREIDELTGRPAYYHLHRYYGRSYGKEAERRCPDCGGEWRLPETWHRLFDFRCDNCRLLSNMAYQLSST